MSRTRLTEREIVSELLRKLDLKSPLIDHDEENVIRLSILDEEWTKIYQLINKLSLDEVGAAWRELPAAIWMDDNWINRVCIRCLKMTFDYDNLITRTRVAK